MQGLYEEVRTSKWPLFEIEKNMKLLQRSSDMSESIYQYVHVQSTMIKSYVLRKCNSAQAPNIGCGLFTVRQIPSGSLLSLPEV